MSSSMLESKHKADHHMNHNKNFHLASVFFALVVTQPHYHSRT